MPKSLWVWLVLLKLHQNQKQNQTLYFYWISLYPFYSNLILAAIFHIDWKKNQIETAHIVIGLLFYASLNGMGKLNVRRKVMKLAIFYKIVTNCNLSRTWLLTWFGFAFCVRYLLLNILTIGLDTRSSPLINNDNNTYVSNSIQCTTL
jgi:hypothetical protein